jgi:DNA polymerase I
MISQTIGFLRDTRVEWFKARSRDKSIDPKTQDWYAVVEKALKVFVNAAYGVTGAQHFELFCMPAAESVTAFGRNAIMKTKQKAESMGIRVLYGDTDSVFLDRPTEAQQAELVRWSRDQLGIDLEVDKTYKYVALSERKKNYIGVYSSGYVEVKGLSGKKRNTPDFVQDAFRRLLDALGKVDNPQGFENAKTEIREVVNCVIDRLEGRAEQYSPEELAFRVQMTKKIDQYGKTVPQHVRAAQMMREAGYDVEPGTVVEYIKTKDGVLPIVMATGKSYWIDKEKYIDTLRSVFDQVLDSVGLAFEELLGFTTLDQFF